MNFGAYTHARPDGHIFYVGKGGLKRAYNMKPRNLHHANIVAKHGKENIIVGWVACESEAQAFGLERHLIATCKEVGIKLCNLTDGGEGASGFVHSVEHRTKVSAAMMGHSPSAETRAKISATLSGCKLTPECRAKISVAKKGKKLTAEHRAKLSAAHTGKKFTIEHRTKLSIAGKERWAQSTIEV